jgi:hypothetical protein
VVDRVLEGLDLMALLMMIGVTKENMVDILKKNVVDLLTKHQLFLKKKKRRKKR